MPAQSSDPVQRAAAGKAARRQAPLDSHAEWKYAVDVNQFAPRGLAAYGRLCGWTLARAHARTGDRIAVAAYLGKSDRFERAVAEFAEAYADRTERDHAALRDAVATGRVPATRQI